MRTERLYLDRRGCLVSLVANGRREREVESGDELLHSNGSVYFVECVERALHGGWKAARIDMKLTVRRKPAGDVVERAPRPLPMTAKWAASIFQRVVQSK